MTTLYRVWLQRGLRAKTEVGIYTSPDVAAYVASNTSVKDGQTTSVEPVECDESGNVAQYQADQQLARIRQILTAEELELVRQRGQLL